MSLDGYLDATPGDDAVEFTVTVTNTGNDPVDLEFRGGKTVDVVVIEEGTEVWRWSDGRMFTQAIRTERLAPGESMARTIVWEDPDPGAYTAEATLAAVGIDLVALARVRV